MAAIFVEIHNQVRAHRASVYIDGREYKMNMEFRAIGVLDSHIDPKQIEAYRVIGLHH